MKIDMSFHKFFICSSLAFSLTSSVFAETIPIPSKNFNGQEGRVFPYTTLSNPEGTTAVFSGDLIISNIDNTISETSSSCFSNKAGYFTILGQGYTLSFNQIRSASNGAAISDSVDDTSLPLTFVNFKNLLFTNSHTLTSTEASTGAGAGTGNTNTVKANSAMLYSKAPVIFKGNKTILFQQNRSAGAGAGIIAAKLEITGTTTSCSFDSNASSSFGGALASEGAVTLTNNSAPQTFSSNGAAYYGGAIFLGTLSAPTAGTSSAASLTASANSGKITFQNNTALSGGAIYSQGNLEFSNNNYVLFANNTASPASTVTIPSIPNQQITGGSGGAIYCMAPQTGAGGSGGGTGGSGTAPADPELKCTGQSALYFYGNYAATEGGAIYAKKIVLTDNGSTQFIGNVSAKGGAISVAASGTLELTANAGNIVFDHNLTVNTTTNSGTSTPSTHNSIHFNEGATFSTLAASAGNSIFFYDPITTDISQTAAQPAALTINPSSGNYQGNIVFSGETLPPNEAAQPNNVTSTINQKVTLENGSLILKKGAILNVYSFTQSSGSSGSTVLMDVGTTLSTTTTAQQNADGNITLSNLAINLSSLGGSSQQATVKIASTSGTLSITGPLAFVDSSGIFYENHELLNKDTATFTIANFTGTANPTLTNITEVTGATSSPYGYQGTWKLETSPGTPANTQTLTATWTKTSFIPGPERLAPLVPNSLWGNIVDLRAVNQVMETCSRGLPYGKGLCLTGISNFFHCNHTQAARSYRHISGGYVLHANTQTLADSVFGFGFGQLFAKSKDYLVANDKSKVYVITAYTGFTKPFFNISNLFASMATRASYCRSNERLTTNYTSLGTAQAGWSNNGWLGELEANFPVVLSSRILNLKKLIPFVKAEVAYANQGRFKEKNTEGRAFGHGHLMNVSVPAGIKFDKTSHHAPDFYSISLSCISDVYRYNPHCSTVLIANGATWTTVATNPSRWGVKVQASSHNKVNNNIEIYGHGGCEIRRSSRQYTVDLGSKFRF